MSFPKYDEGFTRRDFNREVFSACCGAQGGDSVSDPAERKTIGADKQKARNNLVNRGTQDEVTIISQILDANPVLKQRVLDKIRLVRGSGSSKSRTDGSDKSEGKEDPKFKK